MPERYFITGAAGGIGRAVTSALARAGGRVFATDVDLDALRSAARSEAWDPVRVELYRLDVSDGNAWARAVGEAVMRIGDIDVLFNMAGVLLPGWVHVVSAEAVHRQIDVNLKGAIFGTRAVTPRMLQRGRGHVVNVSALAGLAPSPGLSLYAAACSAVRAYSLAAACELRVRGVAVTVVSAAAVRSPMLEAQRLQEAAALSFAARPLSIGEVQRAILGPVLRRRPIEMMLPAGRSLLARLAGIFTRLAVLLVPLLLRLGRSRMRR